MKYEETSDISTILIEPTDEKTEILNSVSMQCKPVVMVLPEAASRIFQQPADFSQLRHVRRQLGSSVSLVITGSERLRHWARRHGFPVYTSTEMCMRALARRDRLQAGRGFNSSANWPALDGAADIVSHERINPREGNDKSALYEGKNDDAARLGPRKTRQLPTTEPLAPSSAWRSVAPGATEGDGDDDDGWPGWEYARSFASNNDNADADGWPGWTTAVSHSTRGPQGASSPPGSAGLLRDQAVPTARPSSPQWTMPGGVWSAMDEMYYEQNAVPGEKLSDVAWHRPDRRDTPATVNVVGAPQEIVGHVGTALACPRVDAASDGHAKAVPTWRSRVDVASLISHDEETGYTNPIPRRASLAEAVLNDGHTSAQGGSQTIMLVLVALLLLGILGGIVSGYLMAASHAFPG